jgi:hypothetical protein
LFFSNITISSLVIYVDRFTFLWCRMDSVATSISQYHQLDEDDQCEAISDLLWTSADPLDPRILPFALQIAGDAKEFDLARIEVFKWLRLASFCHGADRLLIGTIISRVLQQDSDPDVRAYAAAAASRFLDISGVFETARQILLDSHENVLVRWNAFPTVKATGPTERGVALARQLATDPEFRSATSSLLRDWQQESS